MCSLTRPSQVGAIVSSNANGRLEHKSGNHDKSRYRAYRYVLGKNGRPNVEERYFSGERTYAVERFMAWSTADGTISEKEAMDLAKAYEPEPKPKKATRKEDKVEKKDTEVVDALLAIATEIAELRKTVAKVDPAIVDVSRSLVGVHRSIALGFDKLASGNVTPEDKVEEAAAKEPVPISDAEVDKYVKGLDIMDVVNESTKIVYTKFVDWCRANGFEPCTDMKLSRRIDSAFSLITRSGRYRKVAK